MAARSIRFIGSTRKVSRDPFSWTSRRSRYSSVKIATTVYSASAAKAGYQSLLRDHSVEETTKVVVDTTIAITTTHETTHAAVDEDGSFRRRFSCRRARPSGVVVGIVRRAWRPYACVLDPDSAMGSQYLAEPLDTRIPKINLTTRQADMLRGKLILVSVDLWDAGHRFPTGHYVRTLGAVGDKEAESEAILIEHEVNCAPFSPQVQACLPAKGWTIPEAEIARRLDLRDGGPSGKVLVCSVDPPGCVDIDDALHAYELAPGKYEVGVHIADVGHFIKGGTAIDAEAAARGTTVYLVNKRIDMVPKRLGEDLCSLHEKVDRLAFSCIWEVDAEANILSSRYEKTVIRSAGALSYDEAQARLDDTRLDDPLTASLRILNTLAKQLKARRMAAGALVLGSPEVRFVLDSETSDPTDVGIYKHKDANSMVEEFMLLANCSVAAATTAAFPKCAMLRRHPPPLPGAFESLKRSLGQHGFELDDASSLALGRSLDACAKPDDPYFNQLTRILATRAMQQARYFSSGAAPPSEYVHYGLACPIYTHFTSPIRRYADQVVHRLLAHAIGWEEAQSEEAAESEEEAAWPERLGELDELIDSLNERHSMAQQAERASAELFTMLYFRDQQATVSDAYVVRVAESGVTLLVPEHGFEGYSHLAPPGGASPFRYDKEREELSAGGCRLRMLDRVRVRISVELGPLSKPRLVLAIVEPKLPKGAAAAPRPTAFQEEEAATPRGGPRRGGGKKAARQQRSRGNPRSARRRPAEFRVQRS
mmetsp:Transcript_12716/g.42240  ORF Transcript_12716/g.42240 Transcript_12716/m.42240 type:complete len:766 (-) Transcript_12716:933-3230(-)